MPEHDSVEMAAKVHYKNVYKPVIGKAKSTANQISQILDDLDRTESELRHLANCVEAVRTNLVFLEDEVKDGNTPALWSYYRRLGKETLPSLQSDIQDVSKSLSRVSDKFKADSNRLGGMVVVCNKYTNAAIAAARELVEFDPYATDAEKEEL